jgi:hypothetical protein
MKRLSRFFIVLAVSVSIASCSPPVGTISSKGGLDDMWAVPKRVVYDIKDPFQRTDLSVLGMYRGAVEEIPTKKVDIYFLENPSDLDKEIPFSKEDDYYFWDGIGRKIIIIKYPSKGKEYRYSVEVENSIGIPPDPSGDEEWPWINPIWPNLVPSP